MRRRGQNGYVCPSETPNVLACSRQVHANSTGKETFREEEQSFTCKWFKFVLQVKLLFPNGAQVHLEIWADCILFDFLADLENFVCDTFRSRTCKIKRSRGKTLKNQTAREAHFRSTAKDLGLGVPPLERSIRVWGEQINHLLCLGKPTAQGTEPLWC